MESVFTIIKTDFSKVDGVFHLAASINSSMHTLIKDLHIEQAYEQFKPKIEGTKILAKSIDMISPRFCLVFSSLSAIIGGLERCSYAASNCSLDSLIEYYQSNRQIRWIGINWDAWAYDSKYKKNTNRSALSIGQGFRLLQICLRAPVKSRFIVSNNNLNLLMKEWVNYKENKVTALSAASESKESIRSKDADMDMTSTLKQFFENCLGVKNIGIEKDFYDLGGDSLSLLRLHEMINRVIPRKLKLIDLIRNRSIYKLSKFFKNRSESDDPSCLVKMKATGKKQPLFLVHPVGGTVFCYIELAKYLSSINHSLLAIQDRLLESEQASFASIEDMAQHYLQAVKSIQNDGHYLIGGYSFGANVAFEMAKQLEQQGKSITLFIIDGWARYSEQLRDRNENFGTMMQIVEEIKNSDRKYGKKSYVV